jgi:hypothetical protein
MSKGVVMLPWNIRETTLVGASGLTVVITVAVLLAGVGSVVRAATLAVFVIVPGVLGAVTTISTVAVAPLGKMPKLHVTVLVPEQLPVLGVAESNVTPAGRTSVRVTPLVVAGMAGVPLFVTVKW